jgi:hypothetical protein
MTVLYEFQKTLTVPIRLPNGGKVTTAKKFTVN